jgi:hypothetical protein
MMKAEKPPPFAALLPLRGWIAQETARSTTADAMIERFLSAEEMSLLDEKRRKEAEEHCGEVKGILREKDGEWQSAIPAFIEKRENSAAELDRAHRAEIEDFERQCGDPDYVIAFKKPSLRLLLLRTTEKRLALQREFEKARIVKGEADRLEREEAVEAQKRAIAAMKIEYANMTARHDREMSACMGSDIDCVDRCKSRETGLDPLQLVIARLTERACTWPPRD